MSGFGNLKSRLDWMRATVAALLVLAVLSPAVAQAQDFATFKGDNARTGKNATPDTVHPGNIILNWFKPNAADNPGFRIVGDNDATVTGTGGTATFSRTAGWLLPPVAGEASNFYQSAQAPAADPYRYAITVPASTTSNILADSGYTLEAATFTLTPADAVQRNYSVWIHMPSGKTNDGTNTYFQASYAVVKVIYGANSFIDLVNVDKAGSGWIRLGNGGLATDKLVDYDGSSPIIVKVYNTVPRNTSGTLLDSRVGTTAVYADGAQIVPSIGSYTSSPSVFQVASGDARVVAAINKASIGVLDGQVQTIEQGEVSSYNYSTGARKWRWSPAGGNTGSILDNQNVLVTAEFPFSSSTTGPNFYASDYFAAPTTNVEASSVIVGYEPDMADGEYDVYVWRAGDDTTAGTTFAKSQQVEVLEGTTVTKINVDFSLASGWVKVGNRKFVNKALIGDPLKVYITNYSAAAGDTTRTAYADAVWFVGKNTGRITSTPVQAIVKLKPDAISAPVDTPVVVVATESGKLYCLDAVGNADGTTNVYWTYPSTPDSTNVSWTDPNQVAGLDGVGGVAQMPTQFDMSSALIQRIGSTDRLYIGSQNGRVYCIDMTGRGDFNLATKVYGSTTRLWSYPNDYPSTALTSNLGPFKGSLAFKTTTAGPTIFAGAAQGRMYALDAVGDTVNKVTTTRWTYPLLTAPVIGSVTTTPAVEFGKVFFGTAMEGNGALPGKFFALDQDTGAVTWSFNGDSDASADNFLGGPATASSTLMGGADPDTVFVSNQNRYVYAFNAATGSLSWKTKEHHAGVQGPLTFSYMSPLGAATGPGLLVPTEDGRIVGYFARTAELNILGTRRSYEYILADNTVSGLASGFGWLYGVDQSGYLYAFKNGGSVGSGDGPPPGQKGIVENDPQFVRYADGKMRLITKAGYEGLRNGTLNYSNIDAGTYDAPSSSYEWGQTVYVVLYKFPYDVLDKDGNPMVPPSVKFSPSVEGATLRPITSQSRQLSGAPFNAGLSHNLDGFAVLSFQLVATGANALPPGKGEIQASIISSFNGGSSNYALDPANSVKSFSVANPLGLVMAGYSGGAGKSIAYTVNPADTQSLSNGSPASLGLDSLASTVGQIGHGQSGSQTVYVVDRSLVTVVNGPQPGGGSRGLGSVRVQRNDLAWQGGTASVIKPLESWATGFEDYPEEYPNRSLDYPNVKRDGLRVTKDPTGDAENPLFNGVTLQAPTGSNIESNPAGRTLSLTPLQLDLEIPKYQPANLSNFTDASGATLPGGYVGQVIVYVDTDQKGVFDITSPKRTAYRVFNLTGGVPVDEKMEVGKPTVDLGSLPQGAGFGPATPWSGSTFNPYPSTNPVSKMFQPFELYNKGNVNLKNVRLSHGSFTTSLNGKQLMGGSNDRLAYLDGALNLYSDLDSRFWDAAFTASGLSGTPGPFITKPRVSDRQPVRMASNPVRRSNPSITTTGPLFSPALNWPAGTLPKVTATVPLGFPIGSYATTVRTVEDGVLTGSSNEAIDLDSNGVPTEPISDPGMTLKFKVSETRLTNSFSVFGSAMLDQLVAYGSNPTFTFKNLQPAGARTPDGHLVVAWISDRASKIGSDDSYSNSNPAYVPSPASPGASVLGQSYRLYLGSVAGATGGAVGSYPNASPLGDLNLFTGGASQWFQYRAGTAPFPSNAEITSMYGTTVVPGTFKAHHPAFPAAGFRNPLGGADFTRMWMVVVGDAELGTASGRINESKLILAPVTVSNTGESTIGAPVSIDVDANTTKGKPSIVQISNDQSVIFYGANSAGQNQINYVIYSAVTGASGPYRVALPSSFELSGGPSAVLKTGAIELSFVGRSVGRSNNEVYLARLDTTSATFGQLLPFASETSASSSDGETFTFRGLGWKPSPNFNVVDAGTGTQLLDTTKGVLDSSSGVVVYPSKLGGSAYVDPNRGTVRFVGGRPRANVQVIATYMPTVLRVSSSGQAAHAAVTLVQDNHLISDLSYWLTVGSDAPISSSDVVRPSRLLFTYGRAASGGGQTARPYWKSMRYGIQLPHSFYVANNGVVTITVTGLTGTGFYQADPARGRVYFTSGFEGQSATINYTALNQATGQPVAGQTFTAPITLIDEMDESAIPLDQAVNEANFTTFIDPLDPGLGQRPSLFWMLWSSTRNSGGDIFMQTAAPRFTTIFGQ